MEQTFDKVIEYAIDEAKPSFWIQDIRVEGGDVVIEAEMSVFGTNTDMVFKKPVMQVFTYGTYMSEEWSDMEHEAYKFLDKMAVSFQKEVSNPLSFQFKKLIAQWNK